MSTTDFAEAIADACVRLGLPAGAGTDDIEAAVKHRLGLPLSATAAQVTAANHQRLAARKVTATASSQAQPVAPTPSARLRKDDAGSLVYGEGGFEVQATASGEPAVFTTSGWMAVSAFERAGMNEEDLRAAAAVVQVSQGGPTAQAFRAGPSGRVA
jgi:hypothetical protein